MEYTYEEYQKQREKKNNIFSSFKRFSGVLSDVPFLGNTLKTSADFMTESIERKSKFKESFSNKEQRRNSTYFVLNANNYYGELFEKVFGIIEMEEVQKGFSYNVNDLKVSIEEWFYDDSELVEEALIISFLDDIYINDKTGNEEIGQVYISFEKKFEQINFEDNNVYIAFETIVTGMNHHQASRNYIELADLICHFLSNSKLLK